MAWDGAVHFIDLSTTCKSGVIRTFEVRFEGVGDSDDWLYYAKPTVGTVQAHEEYLANFKQQEPGLLQLINVYNKLPGEYHGCGLTRALIPHVACHRCARVRSSNNGPGETHTAAARRVWESLKTDGLAFYDATQDRFYHPVPPHEPNCRIHPSARGRR